MVDGITFPSKLEARRYLVLIEMEREGLIQGLKVSARSPSEKKDLTWRLEVNDQLIWKYVTDFTYYERGKFIVDDAKGKITPVYRAKAKMMKALYGIVIRETR